MRDANCDGQRLARPSRSRPRSPARDGRRPRADELVGCRVSPTAAAIRSSLRETSGISDEGVSFGPDEGVLTPEEAVRIQKVVGSDIMIVLDDCAPFPCKKKDAQQAVRARPLWAQRSVDAHTHPACYAYPQQLWGIIQGSVYPDLRQTERRRGRRAGVRRVRHRRPLDRDAQDGHPGDDLAGLRALAAREAAPTCSAWGCRRTSSKVWSAASTRSIASCPSGKGIAGPRTRAAVK